MEHNSRLSPHHNEGQTSGPLSFCNPTVRRQPIASPRSIRTGTHQEEHLAHSPSHKSDGNQEQRVQDVHHLWRSRDNRKGRHAISVSPSDDKEEAHYLAPPPTNTLQPILHNIWRMVTYYPIWDASYVTAQWFTWGSVVWVINACFVWLPSVRPSSEFQGEVADGGGITALIGATIFEVGSVFLMIEAVNENRTECFGWAVDEVLEQRGLMRLRPDEENCTHHHRNKLNLVGKGRASAERAFHNRPKAPKNFPEAEVRETWIWFPTVHELRCHYFREIGFLACLTQFIGATIFWISGFTALPSIQAALSTPGLNGAYWAPQIIGGTGFIVSSLLICLETQQKWWKPAPKVLGWWIGAWNLIGAIGFTMSGAFGYWISSKGTYEAGLATFWGSWAFLIGSVLQWYESLVKHPVEKENSSAMDSPSSQGAETR